MSNEIAGTVIRSVLKIGGGLLVARGVASEGQAQALIEALAGAAMAIWGVYWGWKSAKNKPAQGGP
jgi:hypothetical protein